MRETNQKLTTNPEPGKQVKSKKRVTDYGEVFTAQREVNAMLDLVKQETERIDSRFLEPACGEGIFLKEILKRKLEIVEKRYSKSQIEFERYAFIAVASIYGIDLLEDNVIICRNNLFKIFYNNYERLFKNEINPNYSSGIKFILLRNIIYGNALTLKTSGFFNDPIIFSEWSLAHRNLVQRRDFKMTTLLESQPHNVPNLFSDLGDTAFIPMPVKTYPLKTIYEIAENVQSQL